MRDLSSGCMARVFNLVALFGCFYAGLSIANAEEPDELLSSPVAVAFGSEPTARMLRLSPDGNKVSFLQPAPEQRTFVIVVDLTNGSTNVAMADDPESFEFRWCDWANDNRILCSIVFRAGYNGLIYPATRLVGVNSDGSEMLILSERGRRNRMGRIEGSHLSITEDIVLDWLPDDPEHVLVEDPERSGQSVSRLNIYNSKLTSEERLSRRITRWIADGQGVPRLYRDLMEDYERWFVRKTPDEEWTLLHQRHISDLDDDFWPIGFGDNPTELLLFDNLDGRVALFSLDLAEDGERRIVYANSTYDVSSVYRFGRNKRLGAVGYVDDRPRLHFFDETLQSIHSQISALFPEQSVSIVDENWDGRYYLFFVSSPINAGRYYRFDASGKTLLQLFPAYNSLEQQELIPMRSLQYEARDGTRIPAYVTVPERSDGERVPAIVLPHGGPSARDVWSYDFLAQYLAASGYAVLQSNYRGSAGYGKDWLGRGGFREWQTAINDVVDGAQYLVDEGIASPERICAIGWSFGGYAALLSAIEAPEQFRCVVSIAGVTDPKSLGTMIRVNFVGGFAAQTFIGTDDEVLRSSSPLNRANEFDIPVLLFHPAEDMNVPFTQGTSFFSALDRAGKDVEFIEYENAEHSIRPQHYRIDMLSRLGIFLERHIGER